MSKYLVLEDEDVPGINIFVDQPHAMHVHGPFGYVEEESGTTPTPEEVGGAWGWRVHRSSLTSSKIIAFSESISHGSDALRFCIPFRRGMGAVEFLWTIWSDLP